jgi:hypothetical protein
MFTQLFFIFLSLCGYVVCPPHTTKFTLVAKLNFTGTFSLQSKLETFSNYQLNAQFFYFSKICMLHYAPQHVSSSTLLIIRGTNCITTASGIVTLHKQPYSMHTVRLFTEGDDTRGCGDTFGPPEDEQRAARNMLWSAV